MEYCSEKAVRILKNNKYNKILLDCITIYNITLM